MVPHEIHYSSIPKHNMYNYSKYQCMLVNMLRYVRITQMHCMQRCCGGKHQRRDTLDVSLLVHLCIGENLSKTHNSGIKKDALPYLLTATQRKGSAHTSRVWSGPTTTNYRMTTTSCNPTSLPILPKYIAATVAVTIMLQLIIELIIINLEFSDLAILPPAIN